MVVEVQDESGIGIRTSIERKRRAHMVIAYDEDEDGFTFARKTRSKKGVDEPVPVAKPRPSPGKPRAAARTATRSDSKADSRVTSASSETETSRPKRRSARLSGDKDEVVQILPPAEKPKRKRESNELKSSDDKRDGSPDLPQSELQVEKKRERDGTKIALPFADTPVINRNKEMRAMKSKAPNRRSSVTSRGRRASSLIESGTSNGRPPRMLRTYGSKGTPKSMPKLASFASFLSDSSVHPSQPQDDLSAAQSDSQSAFESQDVAAVATEASAAIASSDVQPRLSDALLPDTFAQQTDQEVQFWTNNFGITAVPHADVDIKDFYKHIEHSLLEPKRMRQLLTWSATRALPAKQHNATRDANEAFTLEAARSIVEDLLKDFSNKSEMSDWFGREDNGGVENGGTAIVKKPNPRNAANAARLVKLEEDIARLKKEEKEWSDLVKTSKSEDSSLDMEDIDLSALDPAQAAILAELQPASKPAKRRKSQAAKEPPSQLQDIASRMRTLNSTLEPTIDLFADGIHKMSQYRIAAERVADAVLGSTARKLEIREKSAQEATGTAAVGAMEVLQALSSAMNGRGEGR